MRLREIKSHLRKTGEPAYHPDMAEKTTVSILGLGVMGSGMATRLLSRRFAVTVFNRSPQKAEALRSLGATIAITPGEAASRSNFVISMLADDDASREVWLGKDGALAGATPGSLLIESSTVTVDWIHELAAAAAARGLDLLDAPVAGSKVAAASGELIRRGRAPLREEAAASASWSPTTMKIGPSWRSATQALKMISGPMPAGSPRVTAKGADAAARDLEAGDVTRSSSGDGADSTSLDRRGVAEIPQKTTPVHVVLLAFESRLDGRPG